MVVRDAVDMTGMVRVLIQITYNQPNLRNISLIVKRLFDNLYFPGQGTKFYF